ncbi:MAG: accessory gene regulator B family protein [Peptococcaceae bacterium]|nr:accessory gene regulator B family protein [Peptococcaceae bacterium]
MEQTVNRIIEWFIVQNIIQRQDKAIYSYGLEILLFSLTTYAIILVLAIIFHRIVETIIFLLAFRFLRVHSGGYHAQTRMRCLIMSVTMYVLFLVFLINLPIEMTPPIFIISVCFVIITVFSCAPVVHENRNIYQDEYLYLKKKCRVFCLAEIIIIVILSQLNNIILIPSSIGMIFAAVSLLFARLQTKTKKGGGEHEQIID